MAVANDTVGIGVLSRLTGVPVRTMRFYCDEGILSARRSAGGHRRFDSADVERLRLVRRMRGLGLGLAGIAEVLRGERSLGEVVAAKRVALDVELAALAWRRASLRAVEEPASPTERAVRLELLANAPGPTARDVIIGYWRRVMAGAGEVGEFLERMVPEAPSDPSPGQVVAFAEMVTLAGGGGERAVWDRVKELGISDGAALLAGVAEACSMAAPAVRAGEPPGLGPALDRFVEVHAAARGGREDTPDFRRRLHGELMWGQHPRIDRYWDLFTEVTGELVTPGGAQRWLVKALGHGFGEASSDRGGSARES